MGHASIRALLAHEAHRHACAQGRQTWSLGPSMQTTHVLHSGSEDGGDGANGGATAGGSGGGGGGDDSPAISASVSMRRSMALVTS